MSKTKKIGLILVAGVLLSSAAVYASQKGLIVSKKRENSSFLNAIHSQVLEIIEHSENIPGLKPEEFASFKQEISRTWEILVKQGVLEVSGTDQEVRPPFVALQGILEHVLASKLSKKEIDSLIGVIQTPMPETPLCTRREISM